jgi:hypothetical protein
VLFDIEADKGDRIVGYLVPDSFSASAEVVVASDGVELTTFVTSESRPSVVAAGRHSTGLCGFSLTDKIVPKLATYRDLELRDASTGLTIYRRRKRKVAKFRLFRLEPRHTRSDTWDRCLGDFFQIAFPSADQLGRETLTQTLLLKFCPSCYTSARLVYREFEYSLDESFKKICIIQDPFVELAEILIELRDRQVGGDASMDLRDKLAFGACAEYMSGFDIRVPAELRRFVARMPIEVESILASPMTRLLAAKSADDAMTAGAVATGLETLASFDIVGIRERPDTYLEPLVELLSVSGNLPSIAPASTEAVELADALRKLPSVEVLVDLDVEVYHAVKAALETNFPGRQSE